MTSYLKDIPDGTNPHKASTIALLVTLSSALICGCGKGSGETDNRRVISETTSSQAIFDVIARVVQRGILSQDLSTTGIALANQEAIIGAEMSGVLEDVYVYEGKHVTEGELLLKFRNVQFEIALKEAKAKLLEAQVEYKLLKEGSSLILSEDGSKPNPHAVEGGLDDSETVSEQDTIHDESHDRARRNYDAAKAVLQVNRDDLIAQKSGLLLAERNLERAQLNLNYTKIVATFPGYVSDFALVKGESVSLGRELLRIIDISRLKIIVGVLENELPLISLGNESDVTFPAYQGRVYKGKVKYINPRIDPSSKTARITIELPNPGLHIKPGMYAIAKIQINRYEGRLIVPREALLVRDQRKLVFVLKEGLAKWRYVETGVQDEHSVEILQGVSEGDSVIVAGHDNLSNDSRVRITSSFVK